MGEDTLGHGTHIARWMERNPPGPGNFWADAAYTQAALVRRLSLMVWQWDCAGHVEPRVISSHRSKSVNLPVCEIVRPDVGLAFVTRDNFHNWKVSVESERPLDVDLSGLCHVEPPPDPGYTGDHLADCYFEGFPRDRIYGYYSTSDRRRWSMELHSNEDVWTTLFLVARAAGAIQPLRYSVRPAGR